MISTTQCVLKNKHLELDLESWQDVVNMMASIYNAASADIVQLRDEQFNVVASSNNADNFLSVDYSWPWNMQSFCRRMVEIKDALYVSNAKQSAEWCDTPPVAEGPVRSYLGFPLYWPNGEVFGSICVIDTKPTNYPENFVTLLSQLKKLIEANLRHADDMAKLKHTALHDPLTGCGNRIRMAERLKNQIARFERHNTPFSLIAVDLNKFKPVNDQYGHHVGDIVLHTIANRLQACIRKTDLLIRTGGDEFLIIFSDKVSPAQVIANLSAETERVIDCEGIAIHMTASFGHASFPEDGTSADTLVKSVDKRMYQSKNRLSG